MQIILCKYRPSGDFNSQKFLTAAYRSMPGYHRQRTESVRSRSWMPRMQGTQRDLQDPQINTSGRREYDQSAKHRKDCQNVHFQLVRIDK